MRSDIGINIRNKDDSKRDPKETKMKSDMLCAGFNLLKVLKTFGKNITSFSLENIRTII